MPVYDFHCPTCGDGQSISASYTDIPTEPECILGHPMKRIYTAPGVVFKGSGFYQTDSRRGRGRSSSDERLADNRRGDDGSS